VAATIVQLTDRTVDTLALLGPTAYREAFTQLWVPQDLAAWLKTQYAHDALIEQLRDPAIHWRIAYAKGKPVGFAKLVLNRTPDGFASPNAAELEKIYLRAGYTGKGYGHALYQNLLAVCKRFGIRNLWLRVLDTNVAAQNVYLHWGFAVIGTTPMNFGTFQRTMVIMQKQLD
jgi:GNAT superfamily N-acetyltransferase